MPYTNHLTRREREQAANGARSHTFARAEQLVWIAVGAMLVAAMATPAVKVIWRML